MNEQEREIRRLIAAVISTVPAIIIRFSYPELTETELFSEFWVYWVSLILIWFIVVIRNRK